MELNENRPSRVKKSVINSSSDRWFHILNYAILTLFTLIVLYPLVFVVSCSLSSAYAVISNKVWLWPVNFSMDSYKAIIRHPLLLSGYGNAMLYTVFGTAVSVVLLLTAAYPLSRKNLPGRGFFTVYFLLTMFFNGGTIPNYILVLQMRLKDSRLALIIPFMFSAYTMIIVRTYFSTTIPPELNDSAQIDGCTDIRFFFRIALPLSGPVIAVVTLMHAVGNWNGFYRALLYLNTASKFPLQLVLRDILFISQMPMDVLSRIDDSKLTELTNAMELLKYSVIVVAAVPVMILYPFIQRYFVKGMMIGSVKG